MKNNWGARILRTFTAFLPRDKKRKGECLRCGECCKLPNVCPFLRYDENHKARCLIYHIRPMNCRVYPRTKKEHITKETCGYYFD
ncbi:MAG: YkgJ family cysteine cluster protein [Promethearchaeota archaeon]